MGAEKDDSKNIYDGLKEKILVASEKKKNMNGFRKKMRRKTRDI